MRLELCASIVVLAALCTACSSVRIQYDFDPSADFSSWRTYSWYVGDVPDTGDPRLDNPLLNARIETAVDRTLGDRGYAKKDGGNPDFYVRTHVSTEQRLDVRTMNRGYMGGPHGRGWGGAGTRRLSRRPERDRVTERVNEAVAEVLGQFPPR